MARQVLCRGKRVQLARDTILLPDGQTAERDVVLHPGAVAMLVLVDDEHLCLLRNRRLAVGETLWEIPAGTLEGDEAPETAAVRELREETGYEAGQWRKLAEFFPSPGVLSERMHLFLARDLTPGPLRLQPDEELEPKIVAWSEALRWALDGTIRDAKTLIALLLWDRMQAAV
jgi:ADP-ribose pyrophosphatase